MLRGAGAAGKPITLRAAHPGKAVFTGASSLEVKGAWLVVDGLVFDRCTVGPLTLRDAQNCRVTNCLVRECNPEDRSRIHWVRIAGSASRANRIDHCALEGKRKDGVMLVVDGDEGKIATDTQIDHNLFTKVERAVRNGMETIRVGTSDVAHLDSRTVVEHNLFDDCSGDAEIISSKSCRNVFRYNTFRGCDGGLVLRHGHRSLVEGNFFFGGRRRRTGGVRVHGSDHRVVNNYLQGLGLFSISLPAGQSNALAAGHQPTVNCVVAHNTVADAAGPAIVLGAEQGEDGRDRPPSGLLVNNLVTAARGALVEATAGASIRWAGNLLFGPADVERGLAAGAAGVLFKDPRLTAGADELWRPSAASPALGAAAAVPFAVPLDIDGQKRPARADIGADQRSNAAIIRRPLTSGDVGPAWMLRR